MLTHESEHETTHDGLSPQRDSKCLLRADGRVTAAQVAALKMNVITALPYTITTPGTYVLLGNLVAPFTEGDVTMITINAPTGKVVFNLNNFTIDAYGYWYSPVSTLCLAIESSNVTVENGTISNFDDGIFVAGPYFPSRMRA
jgi:hypothetical protein